LVFTVPDVSAPVGPVVQTWSPVLTASGDTRMQRLDAADVLLESFTPLLDCYTAAASLAACHHLPTTELLAALRKVYATQEVPEHHVDALGQQIEAQRNQYEETWDEIEVAVALVKADGFDVAEVNGSRSTPPASASTRRTSTCTKQRKTPPMPHMPCAAAFTMKATTSTPTPKPNFWTGRWACCRRTPTRLKAFGSRAA
jgi:type III restriction enzyme